MSSSTAPMIIVGVRGTEVVHGITGQQNSLQSPPTTQNSDDMNLSTAAVITVQDREEIARRRPGVFLPSAYDAFVSASVERQELFASLRNGPHRYKRYLVQHRPIVPPAWPPENGVVPFPEFDCKHGSFSNTIYLPSPSYPALLPSPSLTDNSDSAQLKTAVLKGFGNITRLPYVPVLEELHGQYPPLSNAAYEFSTHYHRAKFDLSAKGLLTIREHLREQHELEVKMQQDCLHKYPVKSINDEQLDSLSATGDLPTPVDNYEIINKRTVQISCEEHYEFCSKCKKRHISNGPSNTLEDRDTCRSLLPAWFPNDQCDGSWACFQSVMNEAVKLDEIKQGLANDPTAKPWNKEYHEPTRAWRAVGRYGGWWRCRTGREEGGKAVPQIEKACRICHGRKTPSELEEELIRKRAAAEHIFKEKRIPAIVEGAIKIQGTKDKALCEAEWRM
jgi:hypothetical protein